MSTRSLGDKVGNAARRRIAMLLLADPAMDARVTKTTRSLQAAGYQVTLYCLAARRAGLPMPDLHGATVEWVTAPRPLRAIRQLLPRLPRARPWLPGRRQGNDGGPRRPDAGMRPASVRTGGPRGLLAELRAFLGTLWLNLALARAAARRPAAFIHANDLDTLVAGILLQRILGAALVYDAHELYPEMVAGVSALYAGLWRRLERALIGSANVVLTVDDALADELTRRYRLSYRPRVVMNCPPLVDQPASASLAGGETRLLYQGGLHAGRGLEHLVALAPRFPPGVALYLRGGGPFRADLVAQVERLGLADRVIFLDPVPPDELVSGLAGFAIGLVPYVPASLNTYLSAPNKLFEYMMGGLPVVACDLPEVRRVFAQHAVGALYPARRPEALLEAVNGLLGDPERLARCGRAAREAALTAYNWQAQERVLRAAYAGLWRQYAQCV